MSSYVVGTFKNTFLARSGGTQNKMENQEKSIYRARKIYYIGTIPKSKAKNSKTVENKNKQNKKLSN